MFIIFLVLYREFWDGKRLMISLIQLKTRMSVRFVLFIKTVLFSSISFRDGLFMFFLFLRMNAEKLELKLCPEVLLPELLISKWNNFGDLLITRYCNSFFFFFPIFSTFPSFFHRVFLVLFQKSKAPLNLLAMAVGIKQKENVNKIVNKVKKKKRKLTFSFCLCPFFGWIMSEIFSVSTEWICRYAVPLRW